VKRWIIDETGLLHTFSRSESHAVTGEQAEDLQSVTSGAQFRPSISRHKQTNDYYYVHFTNIIPIGRQLAH
jgi:hypothetical protein